MNLPKTDREAVTILLTALADAGCKFKTVDDYDDIIPVDSVDAAVDAVMAGDNASVNVTTPQCEDGWLYFVLGNDPEEVLCDYTQNMSQYVDPICDSWWDM